MNFASNHTSNNSLKINKGLSIALICLGLIISAYLLYRHHVITSTNIGRIDVCSTVFGKGCDSALNSSLAYQLGIPLAGWGMIYYATLLIILILPAISYHRFKKTASYTVFALTVFASISSLCLLIYFAFNPSLFCPFCAVIHVINILLVFLLYKASGFSLGKLTELSSNTKISSSDLKLQLAGFTGVLIVAALLFMVLRSFSSEEALTKREFNVKAFLADFDKLPEKKIPLSPDDPVFGPANSPIKIVVYSDFQCPSCRYFSMVLTELKEQYKDKFQVYFKNFPLGKACNPLAEEDDIHPRACEAALAAEAARQQGKFWQYHDALFATNLNRLDSNVSTIADQIGLDHMLFEKQRISEAARKRLQANVEEALQLGVTGTPAVFLNGRAVNDFRMKQMEYLFEHLLEKDDSLK